MSVIIRLQNLPLSANSIDIRTFFRGLSIPDGGVHIVGGQEGDAFIAFSTDEDARQAMQLTGQRLKDSTVRLLLSSRNEMFKVIEQARVDAGQPPSSAPVAGIPSNTGSPSLSLSSSTSMSTSVSSLSDSMNNNRPNGGFPTQTPTASLSMGSGLGGIGSIGMGGSLGNAGNYTTQQLPQGLNVEGLGGTTNSFPGALSSTSTAPSASNNQQSLMSTSNSSNNMSNTPNIFGMSGMPMSFPGMMGNGANSLPMNLGALGNLGNLNPAALMSLGLPPGMLPSSASNPFQGLSPRMMMNNTGTNGAAGNNNQSPMSLPQHPHGSGILGNVVRPPSAAGVGYPAGLNPMFMSGAGGSMSNAPMNNPMRMAGPGSMPIGMNPNIKDRSGGMMMGNGTFRQGSQNANTTKNESMSREKDRSSRSSSTERRDNTRRRRSRSRDRERPSDRRRRSSRSKSRSRSPKGRLPSRRDSRDKDEHRRRSPEKGRGRRDSDPIPTPFNTTDEESPAVKITGIPTDASNREIRDLLRVDVMGGGDGIVRLYESDTAFVKLEKPSDYPRAYRSNGRKLRGSVVNMEGISIERWVNEYKLNKIRMDRDTDRERDRDRLRDKDDRGSDRERPERVSRPSHSGCDFGNFGMIGFNSAPQSSCLVIRNLPPTITSRDVSSRLLKDAPVIDLIVSAGPISNGRHTAVAFVKLDTLQTAQKVIDVIVRSQEGANLVVEVCTEEEFNSAKIRTPGAIRQEQREREPKLLGDAKSIFDLDSGLDDDSCSIKIEGTPPNVSERDVFDFFSDIGLAPVNVKIMYDAHGSCNGQIVCEFSDSHKARRATTKDGMLFGRGHVKVEMMPSNRRRLGADHMLKGIRPSLLGARPIVPGMLPPRFGAPPGPNPFLQAMQAPNGPRHSGPVPLRPRGLSRFGPRNEFASSNGRDRDDRLGSSRSRSGTAVSHLDGEDESVLGGPDMFGKPGCVLALENVPYKANMDDILHHLSSILKLDIAREKIIRRFDDSEKPTGDARVAFDTPAEAKLAHDRLVGTKMWNRLITYNIV